MADVRLTINHAQLPAELRAQTVASREKVAKEIVAISRSIAPVVRGDYRGGMNKVTTGDSVRVVDGDMNAIWKEYGTRRTPAHAVLTATSMTFGRYSGMMPRGL